MRLLLSLIGTFELVIFLSIRNDISLLRKKDNSYCKVFSLDLSKYRVISKILSNRAFLLVSIFFKSVILIVSTVGVLVYIVFFNRRM